MKQTHSSIEEKLNYIKKINDMAKRIMAFIASREFKIAGGGEDITNPWVYLQKKRVTTEAADIFNQCNNIYIRTKDFKTATGFEQFLGEQYKIFQNTSIPVDTFWRKRSKETAAVHRELSNFLFSQSWELTKSVKNELKMNKTYAS